MKLFEFWKLKKYLFSEIHRFRVKKNNLFSLHGNKQFLTRLCVGENILFTG